MSVERRYSTRHPLDLQVYIRYRKRRFSCAHGSNLSDQGMFLDVRNLTLPTGTLIELELDCLGKKWLIPAIVIHHKESGRQGSGRQAIQASGIGVMFRSAQPELYHGLRQSDPLQLPHSRNAEMPSRPAPDLRS